MNRRTPRRPLNTELRELEQELAALTLRVAALRSQSDTTTERGFVVGDQITFKLNGRVETGEVIGHTSQRIRVRADHNDQVYLRAPHNVQINHRR